MGRFTFIILCLQGAILSFNVAASSAIVPSVAKDFNCQSFVAGRLIWFYMLPYGIAALFYGPIVRIFNPKAVELVCFFCFTLANFLAGFAKNIFTLFLARFFMGVFGASVIPLVLILIANNFELKKRGRLIGIFFAATFLASLIGLFLSSFLLWRFIYIIPAILGCLLLVIMAIYLPNFSFKKEIKIRYLEAFKDKKFSSIFIYIFLISMFYHGLQQWLAVYFSERFKFNQATISLLITLTSLSGIFGEVFGGFSSDIFGRLKTINFGTILMGISAFLLLFRVPIVFLMAILIIWGLGWTFNHAGLSTILTDIPKKFLNEAASLNSSIRFFSGGLGVLIFEAINRKDFTLSLSILSILFFILTFISKYFLREEENYVS